MGVAQLLQLLFASLISIGLAVAPLSSTLAKGIGRLTRACRCRKCPATCHAVRDKQKQGDCQDCPLLAICTDQVLQDRQSPNGCPIHQAKSPERLLCSNEPEIAGLVCRLPTIHLEPSSDRRFGAGTLTRGRSRPARRRMPLRRLIRRFEEQTS